MKLNSNNKHTINKHIKHIFLIYFQHRLLGWGVKSCMQSDSELGNTKIIPLNMEE